MTNAPYPSVPSLPSPWGSPNPQQRTGQWGPFGQEPPLPDDGNGRPGPNPSGALAIISFVAAIVAFIVGWVPFVGLGVGFIGLVLSVIAVRKPVRRGLSITGIILSMLAGATSLVTTALFILALLSGSGGSGLGIASKDYSPDDFKEVDERTVGEISKDPDGHKGETLVVYGYVTQFGSETGKCRMRVSISNEHRPDEFAYKYNALAYSGNHANTCPQFDDVLEGDEVKMSVVVNGEESYASLLGGTTSAPALEVIDLEKD